MASNGYFLVSIDNRLFLHEICADGTAVGSTYPSAAWHFGSYDAADAACQRLCKLGYRQSVVTDSLGRGVSIADLRSLLNNTGERGGYFVRLDPSRFVRGVDGHEVECCYETSVASSMPLASASALARKLRRRGFPQAAVVDSFSQQVK